VVLRLMINWILVACMTGRSAYQARSVTDESARHYELANRVHGRNRMACRECNELLSPVVE
jgi:formamidopyrimidine-DNA glycosylase